MWMAIHHHHSATWFWVPAEQTNCYGWRSWTGWPNSQVCKILASKKDVILLDSSRYDDQLDFLRTDWRPYFFFIEWLVHFSLRLISKNSLGVFNHLPGQPRTYVPLLSNPSPWPRSLSSKLKHGISSIVLADAPEPLTLTPNFVRHTSLPTMSLSQNWFRGDKALEPKRSNLVDMTDGWPARLLARLLYSRW